MVELNYDDGAASVFGITILFLYLVPALWYMFQRVRTFGTKAPVEGPEAQKPRSRAEAVKAKLIAETKKKDVLMTTSFKVFIVLTAAAALLLVYLLIRVSGQTELAQYDPFAVSAPASIEGPLRVAERVQVGQSMAAAATHPARPPPAGPGHLRQRDRPGDLAGVPQACARLPPRHA